MASGNINVKLHADLSEYVDALNRATRAAKKLRKALNKIDQAIVTYDVIPQRDHAQEALERALGATTSKRCPNGCGKGDACTDCQ